MEGLAYDKGAFLVLYIPKISAKKEWGSVSDSCEFYQKRNQEIQFLFNNGYSIEAPSKRYGLAHSTLKNNIWINKGRLRRQALFCGDIDYNYSCHLPIHNTFHIIKVK